MNYYYAIIGTSRNACGGVRWTLRAGVTEQDVLSWAYSECQREGSSLQDVAGIGWVGVGFDVEDEDEPSDYDPERDWLPGEEFETAIAKLNDDGRAFALFDVAEEFVEEACQLGLGEDAAELVERFQGY